jgi:hypothetical protein
MLATLYTSQGSGAAALVALDPWTGEQVLINLATRKLMVPSGFPLTNFKVNGYQTVNLL